MSRLVPIFPFFFCFGDKIVLYLRVYKKRLTFGNKLILILNSKSSKSIIFRKFNTISHNYTDIYRTHLRETVYIYKDIICNVESLICNDVFSMLNTIIVGPTHANDCRIF